MERFSLSISPFLYSLSLPMDRNALAALDSARPAIARLDRSRTGEELATDLGQAWAAVETALRSMLGGTPMSGQALIRAAREKQLITFDQANALAEFNASKERAGNPNYHVSDADINAAREGFLKLEASLMGPPADTPTPGESLSSRGLRASIPGAPVPVDMPPERKPWLIPVVMVAALAVIGAGVWAFFIMDRGPSLDAGVEYWQRGQRELAIAEFSRAARDNPNSALPHVYLSRMAREAGNMTLAGEEATKAIQAEPNSAIALREMASYLLAVGNYEVARRFYVRALQANPEDRTSQGFLGCALIKLGRFDEGMRWMNRAGQGSWSGCAMQTAPPGIPPAIPR
jgi:tetratricopeptide (TPR) repeat protein